MKLERARQFALSLPETAEAPHFNFTSFRVDGKIFATAPPEQTHLHVFVDEAQRETALALHPEFTEKLFWGQQAIGVRIALAKATPKAVDALLRQAWARKAPKRLLKPA